MALVSTESQGPKPDVVLQQLRFTKWVGVGGSIVIALAGVMFLWAGTTISPGWPWYAFGILAIAFGMVAAIRTPRARVTLSNDHMTVYGQFWSRTVPRRAITSITPWPFVKWTDSRGRKHSTPVTVLNARGALPQFAQHALEGRRTLHKWAGVGGDYLDDAR